MSASTAVPNPNPWLRILDSLEKKVNRHSFDLWLKPTRYSHADDRKLFVQVPTPEFKQYADRYADLIQEAIDNLGLEFDAVEFIAAVPEPPPAPPAAALAANQHQRPAPAPVSPPVGQARFDWDGAAQLNPNYTFDAFVTGAGNQFAQAAARAVADRPSQAYNPLFLYGGVGLGKTHLMQAIGHETKRLHPHLSLRYISSEAFTNEVVNSIRYEKMVNFRDKFRTLDVLLIDDVQFLAQKERTQEEFFHTFNALHEAQKQIVIASDRPPRELAEIEDRLRSRFEWGLIADIQPPDLETKMAILQKKAEKGNVRLPDDVAYYIAHNIRSNVRELEGALVRLIAKSSLEGREINLSYTQEALKNVIDAQVRKVTVEGIQKIVAEHFGLRVPEIKQKNNSRSIVVPRQIAMYLAKQLTDASLPEIGRQFGGKHHTTVLHSINKIEEKRQEDKDLNRTLNRLTETLSN
jgi:chromosomal replication initiator protein